MEMTTIAIELSDSEIKVVVGYLNEEEPVILYAASFDNKGLISGGKILDTKSLSDILKVVSRIDNPDAHAHFTIPRAVLLLPPIGLEIFEGNRRTLVTSQNNQIALIDIANLTNMLCKRKPREDYSYVSIVPQKYFLDNNSAIDKAPLNYVSSSVGVKALMYMLPTNLITSYKSSLEVAGIRVEKAIVVPDAIASLLSHNDDTPETYFYVDIGATYTSISLIKQTKVYNSTTFPIGGDILTKNIAESFNIDYVKAEMIKRKYGYDTRVLSFDPKICDSVNLDGNKVSYSIVNLKNTINNYLDKLFMSIDESIQNIVKNYPEGKRNFPILFGGGASRLAGLLELFNEKYPQYTAKKVPLTVFGARNEKYLNCVGAICALKDSNDMLEYTKVRVSASSPASAINKKTMANDNGSVL